MVSKNFTITPAEGVMNAKSKKIFKFKLLPNIASCWDEQVFFKVNDEEPI